MLREVRTSGRGTAGTWELLETGIDRKTGRPIETSTGRIGAAAGGVWVAARDLKEGDELRTQDGRRAVVVAAAPIARIARVYNFEVTQGHTYHVGRAAVAVHNGCGAYKLTFASGKTYVGKGDRTRMMASIRRIENLYEDKCVRSRHYDAPNDRESFKREDRLMGKLDRNKSYNQRLSPGRKFNEEDGE